MSHNTALNRKKRTKNQINQIKIVQK